MKVKKTFNNPCGLTVKQRLVIQYMAVTIFQGKGLNAKKAHQLIYSVKSANSAAVIASRNFQKPNFYLALMAKLEQLKIVGPDSRLGQVLADGLDAIDSTGHVDYLTRLRYVQEINKVVGLYADKS